MATQTTTRNVMQRKGTSLDAAQDGLDKRAPQTTKPSLGGVSMFSPHLQMRMPASVGRCRPNSRSRHMKLSITSIARISVFSTLALSAGLLWSQPSGVPTGDGQQQQHRKPPQEAVDACKSAKDGQECNFTSPRGAVKGSCFAPEGKPLACRPKDAPGGNSHPPRK